MAVKVNGGPFYLAPGAAIGLTYYWAATPELGNDMGGRYAYGLPTRLGSGAWVVSLDQRVYTHSRGPREPRGWEYGVTLRNDGPAATWIDVYVAGLDGL